MKKPNSNVVLNFISRLVNINLAKGLYINEKEYKQLCMLPNDVKLIIHLIDQLETDFFMAKNTAISSVANTIKIAYSDKFAFALPKSFFKDKQK